MNVKNIEVSPKISAYPKHNHEEDEIVLALSGNIEIKAHGEVYSVKSGDVMVIPKGIYHEGFSGDGFSNIYLHAENIDFSDVAHTKDTDGSIKAVMLLIQKLLSEKESGYSMIADSLLLALTEYIGRNLKLEYKYPFVLALKNTIYENISNPDFSIADKISKMGFSSDYMRRCFKEETGETPLDYLTRLRIERAKSLLIQKSFTSVGDVASLCGFSDNFYFSKTFKLHTGLSPREYRKHFGN